MGKQIQKINPRPDYKLIYTDLITRKYPEKLKKCESILKKEELKILDVIKLNTLIFRKATREAAIFNKNHRFYDEPTIIEILNYQKKNSFNNRQLANHFGLSRNTVTKWKKIFNV
jgi:hypothetical protein